MKLINYRCAIFENYFMSDNLIKNYKYKFLKIKVM